MPRAAALQVSSPCPDLAVPALGCRWLLWEEAGAAGPAPGRVRGVGRVPCSPSWFRNRPDQFPGALARALLLTALAWPGACWPQAALSFGQELPVRVAYRQPQGPTVLCCQLQHAGVQRDGA